jgi:hypothetical protein
MSRLAAALSTLLLPALASASCLDAPAFWTLAASGDFRARPLSTIAARESIPESCRREVLGAVADHLGAIESLGLCPRGACGALAQAATAAGALAIDGTAPLCRPASDPRHPGACLLEAGVAASLGAADARVAAVAETAIDAVQARIDSGRVPYCLLTRDCLGDPARCRVYLRWLWWMGA